MPPDLDVPEVASQRLASPSWSSGLSVSEFAASLDMGLRPVGLVQGFCVMQWGWYFSGSMFSRGFNPYVPAHGQSESYVETYNCPHGFVSGEHRMWGQNFEQVWVENAWSDGLGSAYQRMVEEARELGAHGIIGVKHEIRGLADVSVMEFHMTGTAVVVEGHDPGAGAAPWTTFLAGPRLGKLFESGYVPISIVAAMSSVRVWANCVTEYLMEGGAYSWGTFGPQEVDQVTRAHVAARELARRQARAPLEGDVLQGAAMTMARRELGRGDAVIECQLLGNRVRRFKSFDPLPLPQPTVRLS